MYCERHYSEYHYSEFACLTKKIMRSQSLNCCLITNTASRTRGNAQQQTESEQPGCSGLRRRGPLLPPMALANANGQTKVTPGYLLKNYKNKKGRQCRCTADQGCSQREEGVRPPFPSFQIFSGSARKRGLVFPPTKLLPGKPTCFLLPESFNALLEGLCFYAAREGTVRLIAPLALGVKNTITAGAQTPAQNGGVARLRLLALFKALAWS